MTSSRVRLLSPGAGTIAGTGVGTAEDAPDIVAGDLYVYTDTWHLQANLAGPRGSQGPSGEPGLVRSVNGRSAAEVALDADDVRAIPATAAGTPGHVPTAQLPPFSGGGAVESVNEKTGAVVLTAGDVGALATATRGAHGGVDSASAIVDASGIPASLPWVAGALAVAGGLTRVMALPVRVGLGLVDDKPRAKGDDW
ncbi:hypothetical protein AB0I22_29200 [Streptomyces sp. NPDC050610]|uniref:hypothetical protein n=1 Tax=Streptomyces sp. NPDC050610 TaxID=3157097 RepID=UPI0034308DC2